MIAIDEYLHELEKANHFNGAVQLSYRGEIEFSRGYGFANYEHAVSNTSKSKFNIASITKQFTSVAVFILNENNRLNVSDNLGKYFPELPVTWKQVTIHQLLTHTSGIPDYIGVVDWLTTGKVPHSPNDILDIVIESPLEFTPGTNYSYCATGYLLLGILIERVSEMSYGDFLQKTIFDPLKMNDTGVLKESIVLSNRAYGYERIGNNLLNQGYFDLSFAYATGNLYSTVEDLMVWNLSLYTNKLVSTFTLEKMITPTLMGPEYGCGLEIHQCNFGKVIGHKGEIGGFSSVINNWLCCR